MAAQRTPAEVTMPRDFLPLIATLMALTALAIDLPLPAFPQIRAAYGLPPDSTLVGQSITYFFLGMALPQLVYGPLSDRFGRRPVLFFGLSVYALGSIGAAISPNLPMLLMSRFLWGMGAAAGRVVVVAVVRDCYTGERMARFMSLVFALFVMVPVLAPSFGSLLIAIAPFHSVYWFCTGAVVLVGLWAYFRLPETLAVDGRLQLRLRPVGRAVGRIFTTRVTLMNMLAGTVLMTGFTSYLASSELIVSSVFNRAQQFPIIFGAVASSAGIGSLVNGRLVVKHGIERVVRGALVSYVLCSSLLVLSSWLSDGRPNFWLWYPLLTGVVGSYMLLFPNFNTLSLGPLGAIAGTASAVTGSFSLAISSLLAAQLDRVMDGSVLPLSLGFLVGGLLAALLFFLSREQNALSSRPQSRPSTDPLSEVRPAPAPPQQPAE